MSNLRSSLQRQILRPLAVLLGVTVMLVTLLSAYLSTRSLELALAGQLERIMKTLGDSRFPLSINVLEQLRELSGAHFATWSGSGALKATTLPDEAQCEQLRPYLFSHSGGGLILEVPAIPLGSESYLAKVVRRPPPSNEVVMVLYPRTELNAVRWRATSLPLGVGLVGMIGVVAITASISRRLSNRLEEVRNQVADIAAGDFHEAPIGDPRDEISDLIESVNHMSQQIRSMQELIGRTERARVLGQLAGGLAHQMRNALTGTRLAIQIHERRCLSSNEEQSLTVALQQLKVMEEHMKRLLSVGKGEKREIAWFHVRTLLQDVGSLMEPFCKHSRVGIDQSLPTLKVLQVHGDYDGLRNALLNLIMNAIEAAGPGGQIEMKAFPEGNDLVFEVYDNGPGPPAEIAAQLFEPFVSGKAEGVGLGLVVVRQAANQHQGTVMWERTEGRTCFRIRLLAHSK